MRWVGFIVAIALLGSAASAGAQGGPINLGPDFSQFSDTNQADCSTNPFSSSPLSAASCTWTSVTEASPFGGQLVGATGTISQISVKVGAVTGPMKVVVMRDELQLSGWTGEGPPPSICCTDVAESQVFTPAANSVTTLPVSLPVEVESNPQTHTLALDFLGLSVLEDGVPVPAAANVHETEEPEEGEPPREVQPETFVESPAMQTGGGPQTATNGKGLLVLLDAVLNVAPGTSTSGPPIGIGGPGNTTPGAPTPTATLTAPALAFSSNHPLVHVKGKALHVRLSCGAAAACEGAVSLQSSPNEPVAPTRRIPGKTKTPRRGSATYAMGTFKIGAGKTRAVELKLSRAGRKLITEHKHLSVWVDVRLTNAKPTTVLSRAAKLSF